MMYGDEGGQRGGGERRYLSFFSVATCPKDGNTKGGIAASLVSAYLHNAREHRPPCEEFVGLFSPPHGRAGTRLPVEHQYANVSQLFVRRLYPLHPLAPSPNFAASVARVTISAGSSEVQP